MENENSRVDNSEKKLGKVEIRPLIGWVKSVSMTFKLLATLVPHPQNFIISKDVENGLKSH